MGSSLYRCLRGNPAILWATPRPPSVVFLELSLREGPKSGMPKPAKKTIYLFAQPKGDQLSMLFPLVLLPVCVCVCVCFWFGHPAPQALSPSQCPQLSTRVRDHRGKSFCSCEVGCLAKCPIQPKPRSLGGRAHGGSGGTFPCLD